MKTILCAAALAAAFALGGCGGDRVPPEEQVIVDGLLNHPELGPGHRALRDNFPAVWEELVHHLTYGSPDEAGAKKALDALGESLAPATPGLIIASDEAQLRLLNARIDLLKALKQYNVNDCAAYFRWGALPPLEKTPDTVHSAVHRYRSAFFLALASAVEETTERPPLTAEQLQTAKDAALEMGEPRRITRESPPDLQCDYALNFYGMLAQMPPSLGPRLFADDVLEHWTDKTKLPGSL